VPAPVCAVRCAHLKLGWDRAFVLFHVAVHDIILAVPDRYAYAPAIYSCRGDSSVTAAYLNAAPSVFIGVLQLALVLAMAFTVWRLWSQRQQPWEILRKWTRAVRGVCVCGVMLRLLLLRVHSAHLHPSAPARKLTCPPFCAWQAVQVAQMVRHSLSNQRQKRLEARVLPGRGCCRAFCVIQFLIVATGAILAANGAYVHMPACLPASGCWCCHCSFSPVACWCCCWQVCTAHERHQHGPDVETVGICVAHNHHDGIQCVFGARGHGLYTTRIEFGLRN